MANKIKDLTGVRIGSLVVIGISKTTLEGRKVWSCQCDCGNTVDRESQRIVRAMKCGVNSHCGCSPSRKTHGKSRSRIYSCWCHMKSRCQNKNDQDYPAYGGRGITICRYWVDDFSNFYRWAVSSGYNDKMTIERINVNLGYSPDNCTWIANERQSLNTRRTAWITYKEKTMPLSDWASELGISYKTLRGRIFDYGWSIDRSFTEPVRGAK